MLDEAAANGVIALHVCTHEVAKLVINASSMPTTVHVPANLQFIRIIAVLVRDKALSKFSLSCEEDEV